MSTLPSSIPLWGQAWELTVYTANGGKAVITASAWEPEALRMTFEVLQTTIPSPYWFADIGVYNATEQTMQNALFNATWVTLKAGFQTAAQLYSIIWDGPVLQTIYTRENVVDQKVSLHCVANPLTQNQIVNYSLGAYSTQAQMVQRMAEEVNGAGSSKTQFHVRMSDLAQRQADAVQFPRGNTVFGMPNKYLSEIADSQHMLKWLDGNSAYITELDAGIATPVPSLIYSPPLPLDYNGPMPPADVNLSLIDTPRQFPQGCIFNVLLDPRLQVQLPPICVQLQRTLIVQEPITPGQGYVSPLGNDLLFFVGQVRHTGDTRGNDWQTEVTAYTTTYASSLLNGAFQADSGDA
jgi:hypothetical protein